MQTQKEINPLLEKRLRNFVTNYDTIQEQDWPRRQMQLAMLSSERFNLTAPTQAKEEKKLLKVKELVTAYLETKNSEDWKKMREYFYSASVKDD